jgi:hypothetical protein
MDIIIVSIIICAFLMVVLLSLIVRFGCYGIKNDTINYEKI